METKEQKARELVEYCLSAKEAEPVKADDLYGVLIEMANWCENRVKDYLVKRVENLPPIYGSLAEKHIVSSIYKDLFE